MSIGALAFLNPWLLTALAALPLIYWLLRTVPPRPKQVEFPATRILVGIENQEKTPAKTPWWLLLIRLLAAALIILALAEPVLNPTRERTLTGSGPVVIAIDNGWAAANGWPRRTALAEEMIAEAQRQGRPVVVAETAPAAKTRTLKLEAPADARATLAAIESRPFAPDRRATLAALKDTLAATGASGPSILWLTDGIDHATDAAAFAEGLEALADGGTLAIAEDTAGEEPLGLTATVGADGKLVARVLRTGGPARAGRIDAVSARGQRLGETTFSFAPGATETSVTFELPLELRNQVTRLDISAERSAGTVSLLDGRSQWQRVGMISGESQEQAQPLLAPLFYLEKAVQPYAEIVRPQDLNLADGIDTVLKQRASVLMLADIGTLAGDIKTRVDEWVRSGGVLVRFAGPRLESGGDDLLPVALRVGGRTLGGALSWSSPQPLADFDSSSLFAGIPVPKDVTVSRQVLADPARLTSDIQVWARLGDGTPLVTAASHGAGQVVLFHVTANSDWSNLPMSGLFVEMLRRVTALGSLAPPAAAEGTAPDTSATVANQTANLEAFAPVQTLDGYGILRAPPPTAEAIPAERLQSVKASLQHPPGYYGAQGSPRALNVLEEGSTLNPLPSRPSGVSQMLYDTQPSTPLAPYLLTASLALVFADIVAVLVLLGALPAFASRLGFRRRSVAAGVLFAAIGAASVALSPAPAVAQLQADAPPPSAQVAQKATGNVTLGYVLTGDATADATSQAGLSGLSRILAVRTAVEPGEPMPVDIVADEIAFFPVLYWPVLANAEALPQATLAKIDAYMKQGGMIIFDTRDFGTGIPSGGGFEGRNGSLQRLVGQLDVPRLEPVPEDHVLTKSFYLMRSFPGRWEGGQLWVEAGTGGDAEAGTETGGRRARQADGVSSILITSNDFAAAWALDSRGRPLYPVVPGGESQREMALRSGINIVMHALTGNYKADQVHIPALLERLGQ